jgi:predicted amino acid racemase
LPRPTAPRLVINLDRIEHNARTIRELCAARGLDVVGVVKGAAGHVEVARAFVRGGITRLGDSRLENLAALRAAGAGDELTLLRLPQPGRAAEVVRLAAVSLNSELETIAVLGREARRRGSRRHRVILMFDLGDLREGFWLPPDDGAEGRGSDGPDLDALARALAGLDGVEIGGVGTNLTCYGGVAPTASALARLVRIRDGLQERLGRRLPVVSGGNTSSLPLTLAGGMPTGVTELRVGEGILLGRDTLERRPVDGAYQDAFVLWADVIEVRTKPSAPVGEIATDAFGRRPVIVDRGRRLRAILAVGRQDVVPEDLQPCDPGLIVLGASSDHLIVDAGDARTPVRVGDEVPFLVGYGSLLAAMTSPYVRKELTGGR